MSRNPFKPPHGMRQLPGYRWRLLAWKKGGEKINLEFKRSQRVEFDELVIDDWFHIEQTDARSWYIWCCDALMYVHVSRSGPPSLEVIRDDSWERPAELKERLG